MKILTAFLSISLLAAISCSKPVDDCIDETLRTNKVGCTYEYAPVCGCDGETYPNACVAKFRNGVKQFTEGPCDCNYSTEGVVQEFGGLGTCDKVITIHDSIYLEVASLPSGFTLRTGAAVAFDYKEALDVASACMLGPAVDISCIKEVGCDSIIPITYFNLDSSYLDQIWILSAEIINDCLKVTYQHSGGCGDHDVRLVELLPTCGTPPLPPPTLVLEHNANGDLCQALITTSKSFDLRRFQTSPTGQVQFSLRAHNVNSYNNVFTYTY